MDIISLDSICMELELGYSNLEAVDIAMSSGHSVISTDSLYITRLYMGDKIESLREAIDTWQQEKKA